VGIVLGSGRCSRKFDHALHGASAGETRTATVTFPADYPTTDLAGRPRSS
jgi:trigger factor